MSSGQPDQIDHPGAGRKWLRRAGMGLLAIVGALLALVAAALIWVTSRAGNEKILSIALQTARQSIRGSLEAKQLEFNGRRLVLRGVVLRDPEGEVVATVESLQLEVSLLSLFGRTLDLSQVQITRPQLYLRSDHRGFNLARAIESREPTQPHQPQSESQPSNFTFSVRTLEIVEGFLDFEQLSPDSHRRVRLEALRGRGFAAYGGASEVLEADLGLDAALTRPIRGPVSLQLHASGKGNRRKGELALTAAGLQLSASGEMAGPQITARMKTLQLTPETARAFVPGYPLQVPISLSAEGAQNGSVAAAKMELKAGRAQLVAQGSFDVARGRSEGISLRAQGIDLGQLLAGGPESDLNLEIHAEGGGSDLASLDGKLQLIAPASEVKEPLRLRGERLGPIRVQAIARAGAVEVPEAIVVLPGLSLIGSGSATPKQVSFTIKVTAANLSAFSRTLGGLVRKPPLRVAGSGELTLTVKGPTAHPGLSVNGAFSGFRYDDYGVQNLTLWASVPNVQKPLQSQLSVAAPMVRLGQRNLRRVSARLSTRERDLEAELRAEGDLELLVQANARVDPDNKGLRLSKLRLQFPEADWLMQKPAQVRFASGDLAAEEVDLRSGSQAIRFHGTLRGPLLRAQAEVEKLDLGLLPKALIDPSLRLAGIFNARLRASGRLPRPALQADADLRQGQFKRYSNLGLDLSARYENDRATGSVAAQALDAHLRAQFDVPVQALLETHKPERIHLSATLEQTRLEDVLHALGRSDPLSGTASGAIELVGTADDPRLSLTLSGNAIRYRQSPPAEIALSARSAEDGKIGSQLQLGIGASQSSLTLRTPLTLESVLKRPPTREGLLATPVGIEAEVHEFPLASLYQAGLVEQDIRGKLSMTAAVQGTASKPSGKVTLALADGALGQAPPVDASLIATAGSAGIQVRANAQQKQRRLLDATASLNAAIGNLKSIEAVAGAPLSVKATLGPMTLDEIRRLTGSEPDPGTSQVNGLLHADLTLSGSLNDPRLNFRSEVDRLSAEGMGLGKAELEYAYASTRSDLSADVATTGGKLEIKGSTRLDLSYPSIRKGLDYGAAPLEASVQADGFDLGFLSGISPTVRTIGGKLRANAAIQGTVALPKIQGQLEWMQGRLALLEYGEYQDIHLQVEGTEQTIHLKELLVRSGGGQLKLTADADRRGTRLSLTGKANLDKFPVISDDQVVASVSMRADMEGEITPQLIKVGRLHIPEAHVELPDTKRKTLQSMELPDDIVLVRNGKPLKKGNLKNTGLGGAGEVGATPPQGARQISIVIDAPRNLWVKGNDLNVEVGLSEGFQVEMAQSVAIFGEVNVFRGRVDVWGRRFDIQKNSNVRFSGQPLEPYVNVTVLHNNEKEQVKVYVTVRGQGKDLKIVTSSDPPLSDTEIYTLIATGRRTLKHNSAATSGSSQAASVVGSLAASELKNAVASKLPLDVLSIQAGDTGFSGTKLEAGTYVTDQVYIGYTGRIGARPERGENSNAVRVEYQITPRWSLEGEYGDAKAGSADLIWSRDY